MPTPGSYLLDTNIVIGLLGGDSGITKRIAVAEQVYVPSIVLGELYYGAHKSQRPSDNVARIDAIARRAAILVCDDVSAERYGRLKAALRYRGAPIPENDLWIASLALQHDLTLVTRDSHFQLVTEVTTESWTK
jgi:tRNA(fMet)-specific endonuclease VapC